MAERATARVTRFPEEIPMFQASMHRPSPTGRRFALAGSAAVCLAGAFWFVQRLPQPS